MVEIRSDIGKLGLSLLSYNFLDPDDPIYMSIIKVANNENNNRNIKIFFIHDINLYSNPFGDTAFYDPLSFQLFIINLNVWVAKFARDTILTSKSDQEVLSELIEVVNEALKPFIKELVPCS